MADEKKKFSLGGIDDAAAEKGSFMKTLWQLVKFLVVSGLVTIIQLVLANILPLIFDMEVFKVGVWGFLQGIFDPNLIFDAATPKGQEQIGKYVADGIVTWGYLLPFFLSNLIANIYGYIQNKKTTFKSDAPKIMFVIYIFIMIALILFSTWFQGWIYGVICSNLPKLVGFARLAAAMAAGFVQMVFLFPMEKFVLLREKKPAEGEEAAEAEEAVAEAAEAVEEATEE